MYTNKCVSCLFFTWCVFANWNKLRVPGVINLGHLNENEYNKPNTQLKRCSLMNRKFLLLFLLKIVCPQTQGCIRLKQKLCSSKYCYRFSRYLFLFFQNLLSPLPLELCRTDKKPLFQNINDKHNI